MARRSGPHSTGRSLAALLLSVVVIPGAVLVLAVAERERMPVAAAPTSSIPPLPRGATSDRRHSAWPSKHSRSWRDRAIPQTRPSSTATKSSTLPIRSCGFPLVLRMGSHWRSARSTNSITRTTLDEETPRTHRTGRARPSRGPPATSCMRTRTTHGTSTTWDWLFASASRPRTTNSASRSDNSAAEAMLGSLPTICFGSGCRRSR